MAGKNKLKDWIVATKNKEWVALQNTHESNLFKSLREKGYMVHGFCSFKTPEEAIDYIKEVLNA